MRLGGRRGETLGGLVDMGKLLVFMLSVREPGRD